MFILTCVCTGNCRCSQQQIPIECSSEHMQTCVYRDQRESRVDCSFCGQNVAKGRLQYHLEKCKRSSICPNCQISVSSQDFIDHVQACVFGKFSISLKYPTPTLHPDSYDCKSHVVPEELTIQDDDCENCLSHQASLDCESESYESEDEAPQEEAKDEPGQGLQRAEITLLPTSRCTRAGEKCPICMSPIQPEEVVRRLPCLHAFHAKCIDEWISRKPTCPVDNNPVFI